VLLLGSTNLVPSWWMDASVQYSPEMKRAERSILGVRYSPGPFRTVSTTYRLARGLSEQVELGWQWPIYGRPPGAAKPLAEQGGRACNGAWYSAGRINYSTRDKRVTDSVLGLPGYRLLREERTTPTVYSPYE
jgi:LPS-assembly protein